MEKFPSINQIKEMATPSAWDCYRYLTYNMIENTLGGDMIHPLPDGVASFAPADEDDLLIATRFSHLFIYLAQFKAIADANLHRLTSILNTYKGLLDTSIVSEQIFSHLSGDLFSIPCIRAAYEQPTAPFVGRGIEMFVDEISAAENAAVQISKCQADFELFLDSIYAVKGFNLSLDMISREIHVPELTQLKLIDINEDTPMIEEFNRFVQQLRSLLSESDRPYAKNKLEIMNSLPMLSLLKPDAIDASAKTLSLVRRELKDLVIFSTNDNHIADLLMTRPKEAR